MQARVVQEPGRPRFLHCEEGGEGAALEVVQAVGSGSSPGERTGTTRWYREAKATKRRGMEDEESESTDRLLLKSANLPQWSRWTEAVDRAMGLLEGQMTRTSSREVISTRQEKLATLARIEPKLELSTLAHHIDELLFSRMERWRAIYPRAKAINRPLAAGRSLQSQRSAR